jgi:hypothetical protein
MDLGICPNQLRRARFNFMFHNNLGSHLLIS